MQKPLKNVAYIDNTNLYKGSIVEGFQIDYKKFRVHLKEKYGVSTAFLFIGFIPQNISMYTQLQNQGYTLVFKPTVLNATGEVKGNCDAEMVLEATIGFFEKKYEKAVIVSSDGDFACLVNFLNKHDAIETILSPRNKNKCSSLLKKTQVPIRFLPDIQKTIRYIKEKTPVEDGTSKGVNSW